MLWAHSRILHPLYETDSRTKIKLFSIFAMARGVHLKIMFCRKPMIDKPLLTAALVLDGWCATARPETTNSGEITTALTQLDTYVQSSMQKTHIPGLAVAVVYQGRVVFLKGYGVRKLGNPAKVDPDTIFEIASVSKPIASTVVASLVGEGMVSWDDRIQTLDPQFALSDPTATAQVTIRDLFSHRSGLPTSAGDVLEDLGYTRTEVLNQIRLVPLAGPFAKVITTATWANGRGHRRCAQDW